MIESTYVFKDVHMCVRCVTSPTNTLCDTRTDKHENIIELLVVVVFVVVAVVLVVNEL